MQKILQMIFFAVLVRPFVRIFLGVHLRGGENIPNEGPAIFVANHNSHLDTAVLMSLFPLEELHRIRPVAAADYFMRSKMRWFFLNIMHIIPINRRSPGRGEDGRRQDPLAPIHAALENNQVVIIYPEGSRGEPERIGEFKRGICHLAERHPDIPIVPIYIHGTGKALPRGEGILVPFFVDVFIGQSLQWTGEREGFLREVHARILKLRELCPHPPVEDDTVFFA